MDGGQLPDEGIPERDDSREFSEADDGEPEVQGSEDEGENLEDNAARQARSLAAASLPGHRNAPRLDLAGLSSAETTIALRNLTDMKRKVWIMKSSLRCPSVSS